jgi:hypothetical protein
VPVADTQQIIASFDGMPADVDTAVNFSAPMRPGDVLDACVFVFDSSDVDLLIVGASIRIELYATNRRTTSPAEARNGVLLFDLRTRMEPMILTGDGSPANEYNGAYSFRLNAPLNFVPEQQARNLVLVIQPAVELQGTVFAKVFRRREVGE